MSHINYLGGLRKEYHHIKQSGEDAGYEPTLVIMHHNKKGRSFMIPASAIWKYIEPHRYVGDDKANQADSEDFWAIWDKAQSMLTGQGKVICWKPNLIDRSRAAMDLAACQFAWAFSKGTGILLCTSYNLAKCMQMFEITASPQAAAQLLLWIQDALDQLKDMPECPEKDETFVGGEATVFIDGTKVTTKDMVLTETEVIEQEKALQ